jgi:hypothetical protein
VAAPWGVELDDTGVVAAVDVGVEVLAAELQDRRVLGVQASCEGGWSKEEGGRCGQDWLSGLRETALAWGCVQRYSVLL